MSDVQPLTEAKANLNMLDYMLIKKSLIDSEFVNANDPSIVGTGIILWMKAWYQVPAGSLPDDDRSLCNMAMYGRDVEGWRAVRDTVLRGWIKCSDGRLYHPVMAEAVNTAWTGHRLSVYKRKAQTLNKRNQRDPNNKHGVPTFKEWCDAGCPDDLNDVLGIERPKRGRKPLDVELPQIEPVELPATPYAPLRDVVVNEDGGKHVATLDGSPAHIEDGVNVLMPVEPRKLTAEEMRTEQAVEIVNYYMTELNHDKITDKVRREHITSIKGHLKNGCTLEELKHIVDYAKDNSWMNGTDPKSPRKYQHFTNLFNTSMMVDKNLKNAHAHYEKKAAKNGTGNENNQRANAKDDAKRAAYLKQGCTISERGEVYAPNGGGQVDQL